MTHAESYIQETGRAGTDEKHAEALLLLKKKFSQHVDDYMKAYCMSTCGCRRFLLFDHMEGYDPKKHNRPPQECCETLTGKSCFSLLSLLMNMSTIS